MTLFFVDAVHRGAAIPDEVSLEVRDGDTAVGARMPALRTAGPGDVVGVDPAQILRRTPRPLEPALEPTVLAAIEFADPALPWLFSPPGSKLPWLMLVVVEDFDVVEARPDGQLPLLHVGQLPVDPDMAGRWAHVQVESDSAARVKDVLANPASGFARSRLLAPKRLLPDKAYLAALVPVFEDGRQAGISNRAVPFAPSAGPALVAEDTTLLPVYDHWRFRTGPPGDFESLARRLQWVPRPPGAGRRRVVVDPIAARLQPPGTPPLFTPAVRDVATAIGATVPPDPTPETLVARLAHLVDGGEETVVRPPLYGAGPAGVARVAEGPPWVADLNLHPDARAAAGTGARVVQRDQEALMEEAWRQLDTTQRANERTRWTQLATVVGGRLHGRVATLPEPVAVRVAAPALARLRVEPEIVNALHAGDGLGVLAPGFAASARAAVRAVTGAGDAGLGPVTTTTVLKALAALPQPGMAVVSDRIGPTATVLGELEPEPAYRRMLTWAHVVEGGGDVMQEAHAGPEFRDPAVERLRALDPEWVLGHAAALEANGVCALGVNARFVEAFLAGANHELARELRWRGYPADPGWTAFRRFWPHPDPAAEDVEPLDRWTAPLGANGSGADPEGLTLFVVRGDLLRRYPETIVCAERRPADGDVRPEIFRGRLEPELTYVAIGLSAAERRQPGWHVSLRLPLDAPRFGFTAGEGAHGGPTGAEAAKALYLTPFRVLVPIGGDA